MNVPDLLMLQHYSRYSIYSQAAYTEKLVVCCRSYLMASLQSDTLWHVAATDVGCDV